MARGRHRRIGNPGGQRWYVEKTLRVVPPADHGSIGEDRVRPIAICLHIDRHQAGRPLRYIALSANVVAPGDDNSIRSEQQRVACAWRHLEIAQACRQRRYGGRIDTARSTPSNHPAVTRHPQTEVRRQGDIDEVVPRRHFVRVVRIAAVDEDSTIGAQASRSDVRGVDRHATTDRGLGTERANAPAAHRVRLLRHRQCTQR